MARKNKRLLEPILATGFFILVGGVFAFVIWGQYSMDRARDKYIESQTEYRRKRAAETTATITDYQERSFIEHESHLVTYQYQVNGKTYSASNESPIGSYETHRRGVRGKVCYDPADPENAFFSLTEENIICGQ